MGCTFDLTVYDRGSHVVCEYNYWLITDNRDIISRITNPVLHRNLMPDENPFPPIRD